LMINSKTSCRLKEDTQLMLNSNSKIDIELLGEDQMPS
jgi:hypothetical protein